MNVKPMGETMGHGNFPVTSIYKKMSKLKVSQ